MHQIVVHSFKLTLRMGMNFEIVKLSFFNQNSSELLYIAIYQQRKS